MARGRRRQGKYASNPTIAKGTADASQLRPEDVQPIVPAAIYAAVAIGGALGYTTGVGNGNPIEGLKTINRGEDVISQATEKAVIKGLEFSAEKYPDETKAVLDTLKTICEGAKGVFTYIDNTTGNVVTQNWNEIPKEVRETLGGLTKVVKIVGD